MDPNQQGGGGAPQGPTPGGVPSDQPVTPSDQPVTPPPAPEEQPTTPTPEPGTGTENTGGSPTGAPAGGGAV